MIVGVAALFSLAFPTTYYLTFKCNSTSDEWIEYSHPYKEKEIISRYGESPIIANDSNEKYRHCQEISNGKKEIRLEVISKKKAANERKVKDIIQ